MRSVVDGVPADDYPLYDNENACEVTPPRPKTAEEKKSDRIFFSWITIVVLIGISILILILALL